MEPVKRGPPSPYATDEEDLPKLPEAEPTAKKAKAEPSQTTESVETNLSVKNGISNVLPLLEFVPRPKETLCNLVQLLLQKPKVIQIFSCFITLTSDQVLKRLATLTEDKELQEVPEVIQRAEEILKGLLVDCKKQLKHNSEEWQLQIAMNESVLESQLSTEAKALLGFIADIITLMLLKDAVHDPFIEQENALDTLRLVVKQALFDSHDMVVKAVRTVPEGLLQHLIANAATLQLHAKKREFVIRFTALPRDYLVYMASGLMLCGANKASFEIFRKKFAIYSSPLLKELHGFIDSQNQQTQNLLLDLFLEEIETMLQQKYK